MPAPIDTILILGGTREAGEIAARLSARSALDVISSLAGRTREPRPPAGRIRVGGFGGPAGLAQYMKAEGIDLLIDATHPFAGIITANAVDAADTATIRLLRLSRPPWTRVHGDRWENAATLEAAAAATPSGARVLLALGSQHIGPFSARPDCHFTVRMVDPPAAALPLAQYEVVIGRPAATADAEADLLRDRAISHIVCRNSGGAGAYAKIAAARLLGLPVIMIDRPPEPYGGEVFASVEALIAAI